MPDIGPWFADHDCAACASCAHADTFVLLHANEPQSQDNESVLLAAALVLG
jgi:hypothetical protein